MAETLYERIGHLRLQAKKSADGAANFRSNFYPGLNIRTGPFNTNDSLSFIQITYDHKRPDEFVNEVIQTYGSDLEMKLRLRNGSGGFDFERRRIVIRN